MKGFRVGSPADQAKRAAVPILMDRISSLVLPSLDNRNHREKRRKLGGKGGAGKWLSNKPDFMPRSQSVAIVP